MIINNSELYNNQYNLNILKKNIERLNLKTILNTQILNVEFCIDYILNEEYHKTDEDGYIDIHDIISSQPHIKYTDFFD